MRGRLLQRVGVSFAGAVLAGLLAAVVEGVSIASGGAGAGAPGLPELVAVCFGLLAPGLMGVGLSVASASPLWLPRRWDRKFAPGGDAGPPSGSRRAFLAGAVVVPPAALILLVFGAAEGLRSLAWASSSAAAGARLSGGMLVAGSGVVLGAFAAWDRLSRVAWLRVRHVGLVLALSFTSFALLVALGTTSGTGQPLAWFGVLRRQELDLRSVGLLALVLLGSAATVAAAERWRVPRWARLGALPIASLLALSALGYAAYDGLSRVSVGTSIERFGALTSPSLRWLRELSDRDADGYGRWFGGGDCDDSRPGINPGVDDVPANGVDEDCSGSDAERPSVEPSAEPPDASAKIAEPLNVVMLSVDTLRWDTGYMGNPRNVSPNLDELAKRSAVFAHAYALASYTGKSVGPMLLGKYGSETHRGWLHFNRFPKTERFVQERLAATDFHTVSVQGYWYFHEPGYGLERGFDVLDVRAAPREHKIEGDRSVTSERLADNVIEQLREPALQTRRFFLWAHFTDPHAEYVPHEGFDFGNGARERYDGEVAFTDHHVGRILDAIAASSFARRTAIVVTSDHGEAFGEHGMWRHGFELWEPLVRVPLLIHVPSVEARRIEEPRSHIDLVPTLLELMNVAVPDGELRGRSLVPDVIGEGPARARPVFIDMPAGPYNTERQAYIDGGLKVIAAAGRPIGVYDLSTDPAEETNLLEAEASAKVEGAVERYKAFRRRLDPVKEAPP